MRKIILNRPFYTTTETSTEFINPGLPIPYPPPRPKNEDEFLEAHLLTQGKLYHNLHIKPPIQSKTEKEHPFFKRCDESYHNYVNKIKINHEKLFKDSPIIAEENIANYLHDTSNRTEYHRSYSNAYDGIVSERTKQRDAIKAGGLPTTWRIDTTNQVRTHLRNFSIQFKHISNLYNSQRTEVRRKYLTLESLFRVHNHSVPRTKAMLIPEQFTKYFHLDNQRTRQKLVP